MAANLNNFDGGAAGKYDPGFIKIFWDGRQSGVPSPADDKMSYYQSYYMAGLYRLGWPSYHVQDLEPGNLRLMWYTVRLPKTKLPSHEHRRACGAVCV